MTQRAEKSATTILGYSVQLSLPGNVPSDVAEVLGNLLRQQIEIVLRRDIGLHLKVSAAIIKYKSDK